MPRSHLPQEHDDKRTAEVFASLALESVSIFAASAIFSLGGVAATPGVPPDHTSIWVNAVLQVGAPAGWVGVAQGTRGALAPSCQLPALQPTRSAATHPATHVRPSLPAPRLPRPPTAAQLLTLLVFEFIGLALEGARLERWVGAVHEPSQTISNASAGCLPPGRRGALPPTSETAEATSLLSTHTSTHTIHPPPPPQASTTTSSGPAPSPPTTAACSSFSSSCSRWARCGERRAGRAGRAAAAAALPLPCGAHCHGRHGIRAAAAGPPSSRGVTTLLLPIPHPPPRPLPPPARRLTVELLALFCPVYYPERDMILLEQCDKPSLFQVG